MSTYYMVDKSMDHSEFKKAIKALGIECCTKEEAESQTEEFYPIKKTYKDSEGEDQTSYLWVGVNTETNKICQFNRYGFNVVEGMLYDIYHTTPMTFYSEHNDLLNLTEEYDWYSSEAERDDKKTEQIINECKEICGKHPSETTESDWAESEFGPKAMSEDYIKYLNEEFDKEKLFTMKPSYFAKKEAN